MIIKMCDFLSPQITLYFKGEQIHSSVFSGLLTILAYILIFIYTVYYCKDFINRVNPTIYLYNRYVEDAGSFSLGPSGIFHYCSLTFRGQGEGPMDYQALRIIGLDRSIETYMVQLTMNLTLLDMNHWVYGPCDYNDIEKTDLNNLIPKDTFSQSACIREFYNMDDRKYYKIGQPGFKYPELAHGASNPNRTLFGVVIERCLNDSLRKDCKSDDDINNFLNKVVINFNIIDEYADPLNYEHPYIKYIYSLTNDMHNTTISLNNMNFNPSSTLTHKGYFYDVFDTIDSWAYSQTEKKNMASGTTRIVLGFYFWMQNIRVYNERTYKKLEDLLSDIGGFGSFVLLVAVSINSLVANYVILIDTEQLVLNIDKVNYNQDNVLRKPSIYRKADEIMNPPKYKDNRNQNQYNQNQNSKLPIFIKEINDDNINNLGTPKSEPLKILFTKSQKKKRNINNMETKYFNNKCLDINLNHEKKDSTLLNLYNKNNVETQKMNQSQKSLKLESINENLMDSQKLNANVNLCDSKENRSKKSDSVEKLKKNKISWFNYFFCYVIFFKRTNPKMKFFEDFRSQLISEENLLQNYSDIYKLLKINGIKNHGYYEINGLDKM